MTLPPDVEAATDRHLTSPDGLAAVGLAACMPNDSILSDRLLLTLGTGEHPLDGARRMDQCWSPQWLIDAGVTPQFEGGHDAGRTVGWDPHPGLFRLDDQVPDNEPETSHRARRRLAGEVAVYALHREAMLRHGVPASLRPTPALTGNARGARFKDFLVHVLRRGLPEGWRVQPEVQLTRIRGLHMRKDVGGRSSDIVVTNDDGLLIAVVSSKWTWRSDRGTEAAQMVPLMKYRPDVPYALVTAEFPRAATVSRESIEDRAYHLCPNWVGAWQAVQALSGTFPETLASLSALRAEGERWARAADLPDLTTLVKDLAAVGSIL